MITGLDGREFILHPGFPSPVEFEGKFYPSLLHAYTAAIADTDETRDRVRGLARWQDVDLYRCLLEHRTELANDERLDIMRRLMRQRFELDDRGAAFLVATGRERLRHDDRDSFWGIGRGRGDNEYGRLLMELRAELAGG